MSPSRDPPVSPVFPLSSGPSGTFHLGQDRGGGGHGRGSFEGRCVCFLCVMYDFKSTEIIKIF